MGKEKKAVAIKYKKGDIAPIVVAKGKRLMAEKIEKIAQEHGVPVKKDAALAESLYSIEVNQYIPEELYEAVARVLVYIYSLDSKTS